MLEEDSSRHAV